MAAPAHACDDDAPRLLPPVYNAADPQWWRPYAACAGADPDLFHPDPAETFEVRVEIEQQAKEVCDQCVARPACAEYALRHEGQGVWGGLTEQERRRLRRGRGLGLSHVGVPLVRVNGVWRT